jgi:hypothetical protein
VPASDAHREVDPGRLRSRWQGAVLAFGGWTSAVAGRPPTDFGTATRRPLGNIRGKRGADPE